MAYGGQLACYCCWKVSEAASWRDHIPTPNTKHPCHPTPASERQTSPLYSEVLHTVSHHSEPTASSLASVFSELVQHPEHFAKLHHELAALPDLTDIKVLAKLPHLNAIINEAMRLHPAALTGGIRKTLDTGVVIGDVFIPPYTTIVAPRYTISKREYSLSTDCDSSGAGLTLFLLQARTASSVAKNSSRNVGPHGPTCYGSRVRFHLLATVR